jgi:hypothetical protein
MPRYYFDTRDNDNFLRDEEGLDMAGDDAARNEASRGLAEMARDVLPGSIKRQLAIEVRDAAKLPLMAARLVFEIARVA